jgi:predicted nucleic acid-binding Zn ribbon protein
MSPRDAPDPSPLRALLGEAASGYGLDDALAAGTLSKRWPEVVGETLASHARPSSLRSGVLRVRADSPVWAHEIGYLVAEIRSKANAFLGRDAVSEVKVWSAPGPSSEGAPRDPARPPSQSSSEEVSEAEVDPHSALERARSAWLSRAREKDPREP